jgi:hypothetical protein
MNAGSGEKIYWPNGKLQQFRTLCLPAAALPHAFQI